MLSLGGIGAYCPLNQGSFLDRGTLSVNIWDEDADDTAAVVRSYFERHPV